MVGILSPEMLEIAWLKAVSLEEPSSWLSLMIIFKDMTLLESVAAVFGMLVVNRSAVVATEAAGGGATGAQEDDEDAGEAAVNEACAALGLAEVEADVGAARVSIDGAAIKADGGEAAEAVVSVEEDVFKTEFDITEKVDTGRVSPPLFESNI